MLKKFEFTDAASFFDFLESNREKYLGQKICRFYSDGFFGEFACGPIAFELEDCAVIIDYAVYSHITIHVADIETFRKALKAKKSPKSVPEELRAVAWIWEEDFPFIGSKIEGVGIDRFSHAFEINPSTGETRPAGGDYFSKITVYLEDGREFYICAAPPICDGGIEVWS